MMGSEAYVP